MSAHTRIFQVVTKLKSRVCILAPQFEAHWLSAGISITSSSAW